MALNDEEKIAFRNPKGIYCNKVMSFGLKKCKCHILQKKMLNVMLNNLVVKSKKKYDHLKCEACP